MESARPERSSAAAGAQPLPGIAPGAGDFRRVLEAFPDGIAVLVRGRVVFANAALARMLGYSKEELESMTWAMLVSRDELPGAAAGAEAASSSLPGVSAGPAQRRLLDKSGNVRHVEALTFSVEWGGAAAVAAEIRWRPDRENLESADRLAALGELAAGVAHEINNPLAYVVANVAFALEQIDNLPAHDLESACRAIREALAEAHEGVERVRQVAGDLRTFSHSEERDELVDLGEVLDRSVKMAGATLRHRATIVREIAAAPRVKARASRLGQVFLNLLVNAFHAVASKPGEAQITVRSGTTPDGFAFVEVEDTGVGIAPDVLEHVFEPFFTTKPAGVGTGLGLAVCRNIIREHDGSIDIESRPGLGTVVSVVLPPAPVDFKPHRSLATLHAVRARRLRVLVIDDDPLVLNGMRRLLRAHDATVAAGGRAALELLAQRSDFDVILCDLMMPDVSGMDVYDTLSRSDTGLERRIVFASGGAVTPEARSLLERVPNLRVEKPLDPRHLDALLLSALEAAEQPPAAH